MRQLLGLLSHSWLRPHPQMSKVGVGETSGGHMGVPGDQSLGERLWGRISWGSLYFLGPQPKYAASVGVDQTPKPSLTLGLYSFPD